MSLHAQLSPEAQARLAAQRRTSTVSSLLIALLVLALIAVILMIIGLAIPSKEIPTIVSYSAGSEAEEDLQQRKVQTNTQRKPSSPSSSMAKVIASTTASPTAIPIPEVDVPDPSTNFGDGDDFGDGWGDGGDGAGGGFGNIPVAMKKRCSLADRLARLEANGGTKECEDAVVKALQYFQKTQSKDGSWTKDRKVSMTSLALLAYLGHCETAQSEEFGETVFSAITYLVNKSMKNNGKLADDFKNDHWCYDHSIAVYALAEAYTLCVKSFSENIPNLEEAVLKSGQFMINSQHKSGGWDYGYKEDSKRGGDTSIVGWHVQALKACNHTGLEFKNIRKCSRAALDYMESKQMKSGAIGYSGPKLHGDQDGTTLAAVGALCFQMWDKSSSPVVRKACKFIDSNMRFEWEGPDSDIYGHYYAAQAMINYGGDYWKSYNKLFRDQVLKAQAKDGSFKDVASNGKGKIKAVGSLFKGGGSTNTHYRTALATMMLEVYYRFLPSSQKTKG
ncbi:MAG: prenyltransferase/squalene oxidase repeat-containing protein [Akkermansiaceae bacterium]